MREGVNIFAPVKQEMGKAIITLNKIIITMNLGNHPYHSQHDDNDSIFRHGTYEKMEKIKKFILLILLIL